VPPRLPSLASGFTLLELLVVLAIIAFASAGVGFALRDDTATRLERDALRLGALLEAARAQAQMTGAPVRWRVTAQGFLFEPEPDATADEPPPRQWLDPDTRAQVERLPGAVPVTVPGMAAQRDSDSLLLGPDAIIAPQVVTLFAASQPQTRVRLATDGVRPFAVQADTP
jgi:general secretion pathway protein H